MKKIYVDGCSFTYGHGLDRKYSLANLIGADMDFSFPGKSNYNIIYDLYRNIDNFDLFVIGFTFADRVTLWNNDIPLNVLPTKKDLDRLYQYPGGELLEEKYKDFHMVFYTLFNEDYQNTLSDFIIDGISKILENKNKKMVLFSMEHRNCATNLFYPRNEISTYQSNGHFTKDGMKDLASIVTNVINGKN